MGSKCVYFAPHVQRYVEELARGRRFSVVVSHILMRYEALMRSLDGEMRSRFSPEELELIFEVIDGYRPPLDFDVYLSLKEVFLKRLEIAGASDDLIEKLRRLDLPRVLWLLDQVERRE